MLELDEIKRLKKEGIRQALDRELRGKLVHIREICEGLKPISLNSSTVGSLGTNLIRIEKHLKEAQQLLDEWETV